MNRDSNLYTFLFIGLLIVGIASILTYTARTLKPMQDENVRNEKMQNILSTVGVNVSREEAESNYKKFISQELSLKLDGSINQSLNPFSDINLVKELKKDYNNQHFPLYVAEIESEKFYIVELRGFGLWDAIWGYISFESDFNTIKGASFDHKGETAGLGAEITQEWFKKSFEKEKIFNDFGDFVGITVLKGNNDSGNLDKNDHEVDAISGSTITGDGVTAMIYERIQNYIPFIEKMNKTIAMN